MDKVRLFELAGAFRKKLVIALEKGECQGLSITAEFPHASCDDASLLLAAYLTDHGVPGAVRVHGEHGGLQEELRSHVWLLVGDNIVDITASQFNGYDQPEILVSTDSRFHATFDIQDELEPADFRVKFGLCPDWLSRFGRSYSSITSSDVA